MVKKRICAKCGEKLREDTKFCYKCGERAEYIKVTPEKNQKEVEVEVDAIAEGKRQLRGTKIFMWVNIVGGGIFILYSLISWVPLIDVGYVSVALLIYLFLGSIFLVPPLFVIRGIKNRLPYTVPLVRVVLIISMLNIPVGTIIGVILWIRINNPYAKLYLNYAR